MNVSLTHELEKLIKMKVERGNTTLPAGLQTVFCDIKPVTKT